jgi:hypothetical protein
MAFGHLFGYQPEEAAALLEAALMVGEEPVEVMKQHPEERHGLFFIAEE